ncbi:MAG: HNH endonuclease signature motif containing protein [Pseudomonadota bacterium]
MPADRGKVAHGTVWKKQRPTLDHIQPRSKGGRDTPDNLQLAHADCNRRKGDRWTPTPPSG